MPANLDFLQASTLTCSGLTAWNALFGLEGLKPKKGDWVLIQGTGGVSIAALQVSLTLLQDALLETNIYNEYDIWQFALAAGATIIATTSSTVKAERLKSLGAHHVLNYREDPNWGETAKGFTPNSQGVNIVVDVGGLSTLPQSVKAIRAGGLIALAGLLGGASENASIPTLMDCLVNTYIVRGLMLGTRVQYREMNQFIEENDIKPILDDQVFDYRQAKEAYHYLQQQRHFSKVCIRFQRGEAVNVYYADLDMLVADLKKVRFVCIRFLQ